MFKGFQPNLPRITVSKDPSAYVFVVLWFDLIFAELWPIVFFIDVQHKMLSCSSFQNTSLIFIWWINQSVDKGYIRLWVQKLKENICKIVYISRWIHCLLYVSHRGHKWVLYLPVPVWEWQMYWYQHWWGLSVWMWSWLCLQWGQQEMWWWVKLTDWLSEITELFDWQNRAGSSL